MPSTNLSVAITSLAYNFSKFLQTKAFEFFYFLQHYDFPLTMKDPEIYQYLSTHPKVLGFKLFSIEFLT